MSLIGVIFAKKLIAMKKLILPFLILCNTVYGQITYVDNNDIVYPYGNNSWQLDIDGNGLNDITFNQQGSVPAATFAGLTNSIGANKVQGSTLSGYSGMYSIDCTNDTINSMTVTFTNSVFIWKSSAGFTVGTGNHKQSFRLACLDLNGNLVFKYGYIDYTLLQSADVIIHGWYYDNSAHVPIIANTSLDYPFDGNCIHYDTVMVQDTITTTIYDTVIVTNYTTVTDTLVINTTLGLPAPNNQNIILVYPNPASDHINIDNGNYISMAGYSIKIENATGQQVFQSIINQPQFYVDLSSWTGNGLYYIYLIDPQNNTVTIRKIVLQ